MTNEEKRIKIAEACGWTDDFAEYKGKQKGGLLLPYRFINKTTGEKRFHVPDYFSDLNACHEMEKTLKPMGGLWFHDYTVRLLEICTLEGNHAYCATASQRAEAFGKTMNLW